MVYFCDELELWRLEGIVRGEVDVQEKHAARVRGVIGTHDRRLPVERIRVVLRASGAVSGWVLAQIDQFFLNAFKCHFIIGC